MNPKSADSFRSSICMSKHLAIGIRDVHYACPEYDPIPVSGFQALLKILKVLVLKLIVIEAPRVAVGPSKIAHLRWEWDSVSAASRPQGRGKPELDGFELLLETTRRAYLSNVYVAIDGKMRSAPYLISARYVLRADVASGGLCQRDQTNKSPDHNRPRPGRFSNRPFGPASDGGTPHLAIFGKLNI